MAENAKKQFRLEDASKKETARGGGSQEGPQLHFFPGGEKKKRPLQRWNGITTSTREEGKVVSRMSKPESTLLYPHQLSRSEFHA